jgi:4'-phosphopantetheinyl transferase
MDFGLRGRKLIRCPVARAVPCVASVDIGKILDGVNPELNTTSVVRSKKRNNGGLKLHDRDVHVWLIHRRAPDTMLARFESTLAAEEIARANRFRYDHLRRSYVLARAALKILLAAYTETVAAHIQFDYGPSGKPTSRNFSEISFNVAHSKAVTMLAFTRKCELGVDVEELRPLPEMADIARQFFCPEEAAELLSLPVQQRQHAFFLCWTRKEAYLKAVGDGLAAGLNNFRVSLRPGEPARFIYFADQVTSTDRWVLHDLRPVPGYAAALAYSDTPREIEMVPPLDPAELLEIAPAK